MKLYNTASHQLESLKPLQAPIVKIYSCGPTVYDEAHIGNWSAYIYWDILVRALELDGYQVERVINLTDVGHLSSDQDEGEDKLVVKAAQQKTSAWQIADTYIHKFMIDFQKLNLIKPQYFARATDFIPEQLDIVRRLHDLGLTYQIDDGIYLDTSQIKDYGKLAQLDIAGLKAGARVQYNPQKKQATDFALWKFSGSSKRDMEWPTPSELLDQSPAQTVMGFPGWHLECSAIIYRLLGATIDIHTGGVDHIPVHHTNEIAQMEPITQQPVAQIWLHNQHMQVDGHKIAKSLGNGFTISDLAREGFSALDFKLFVLQSHYQNKSNFSLDNLQAAQNRLANWRKIACLRHQLYDQGRDGLSLLAAKRHILELANNNLDTPQICAEIDAALGKIDQASGQQAIDRRGFQEFLEQIDQLLGLQLLTSTPDISDSIKQRLQQRQHARQRQDFKIADQIRQELAVQSIGLSDRDGRSYWFYL